MEASRGPSGGRERREEATPSSFTYPLQKHDARLGGERERERRRPLQRCRGSYPEAAGERQLCHPSKSLVRLLLILSEEVLDNGSG